MSRSLPTNGEYYPGRIFRTAPPKVRHTVLRLVWVSLLLVPSLLTLTLASTGLSATGATASTLIVAGVAIGPVHLGMSVREVTAILGPATPGNGGQLRFPRWGITVSFAEGVARQIWTANRLFRTKYGAGVGISQNDANRLVGDPNSVTTPTGDSVTVLYAFQGIGFVFRADRAISVFVKQPLQLGSTGSKPPAHGKGSGTGGGTTTGSGGTTSGSGGTTSGGTTSGSGGTTSGGTTSGSGGTTSGGTTSGSGGTTSGGTTSGGGTTSVGSVAVDSNGNFVVNGVPFLLIQGSSLDYRGWQSGGYTQAQADTKMTQMVQNGFNTLFSDWYTMDTLWPGGSPTQYADVLAWQKHGLYHHGSATLDDLSQGIGADYTILNNPDVVRIMTRFKSRPNLLLWWITPEFDILQRTNAGYCTGAATVKGQDPSRTWGDTVVNDLTVPQWDQLLPCMPVEWVEATMTPFGSGEAVTHLFDGLTQLNQAWTDGKRFVLGFSTTPIPELDPGAVGDPRSCLDFYNAMRVPNATEIHRYFMYQVANNVRAFDVLWGPNQRCGDVPSGDALAPVYLTAWNNVLTEMSRIKSLASVILAPGRWQPLATTPAFVPYFVDPTTTGNDFHGVFAAKKTVGGVTYVVACNMDFHQDVTNTDIWTEHPISSATINVGQPIATVTRLFESGTVTFSGSSISDSFGPMGVHVYAVR